MCQLKYICNFTHLLFHIGHIFFLCAIINCLFDQYLLFGLLNLYDLMFNTQQMQNFNTHHQSLEQRNNRFKLEKFQTDHKSFWVPMFDIFFSIIFIAYIFRYIWSSLAVYRDDTDVNQKEKTKRRIKLEQKQRNRYHIGIFIIAHIFMMILFIIRAVNLFNYYQINSQNMNAFKDTYSKLHVNVNSENNNNNNNNNMIDIFFTISKLKTYYYMNFLHLVLAIIYSNLSLISFLILTFQRNIQTTTE
jgi:hypothetical protein